jgi:prolyl 4-hydroxylase
VLDGDPVGLAAEGVSVSSAVDAALVALDQRTEEGLHHALRLIDEAAAAGDGAALQRKAAFLASGMFERPDWDESVTLLRRAAATGFAPAQEELAALMAGPGGALDLGAFVRPRPTQIVHATPHIRISRAFFSARECRQLIDNAQSRLARATVYAQYRTESIHDAARTNSEARFDLANLSVLVVLLRARIANTIGAPLTNFEPATVLHYAPGQAFEPHFDFLDPALPGHREDLAVRGQRIATVLVYLNEGYESGETAFPNIGWRFRGAPGDMLVFANVDRAGAPDRLTFHAGLPPTRGEKWLLSQWVRDRRSA